MAPDLPEGEAPPGEDGGHAAGGEEGTHVNGVDRADRDQDMVTGEEPPAPTSGTGMTGERQPNKLRVTTPYLTKYERARILGTRALQIRFVYSFCIA